MRVYVIEITDILETRDRAVKVKLKATGKSCWLPRANVQFSPGRAILPYWLAKKIFLQKEKATA